MSTQGQRGNPSEGLREDPEEGMENHSDLTDPLKSALYRHFGSLIFGQR